ncbi:MAG: hypothetical protein PHF00_13560 [Elusimicrobia bacterium]|nr:hypothetical protein [Elusimicrobiota bacterium]
MRKAIVGSLLMLAASGAWAQRHAQETPASPQLQITVMTGKVQIQTPGRPESRAGQNLPYIRPDSIVRILSGMASFESAYHTDVRAIKGNSFQFTSSAPQEDQPAKLRFTATADEPEGLDVRIGSEKFLLRRKGDLSVSATAPGELTVRNEGGEIERIASGATRARTFQPGETILVPVAEEQDFESAAVDVRRLSVSRVNPTTFDMELPGHNPAAVSQRERDAEKFISGWPALSRQAARMLIEKYGPPDRTGRDQLAWDRNGQWKRTVVYRVPTAKDSIIAQTIDHSISTDNVRALEETGLGLRADALRQEITATNSTEERNFLAMNLAHDVLTSSKTPAEAQSFYDKTLELSYSGKYSPYTKRLVFLEPEVPVEQ